MDLAIKLLNDSIEKCKSAIEYNSKFLTVEEQFFPERYKNSMIKIRRLTNMIESYKTAIVKLSEI
jgi:hypothetical protein